MHRALVVALLFVAPACKKKPPEEVVPVAASPAPPPPETPIDALNPPPPVRPADMTVVVINTLNGDPNGPKQADLDPVQAEGQRRVQACLDAMPAGTSLPGGVARLTISYEVANDGHPANVAVDGPVPTPTLACGKGAMEGLAFPKFAGPNVKNSFSLTYSRALPPPSDAATR